MGNSTTSFIVDSEIKRAENQHSISLDRHIIIKDLRLKRGLRASDQETFRYYSEKLIAFTHQNLIQTLRIDYHSSKIFIMMEAINKQEYKTVNDYLQDQTFEIPEALALLRQLASVLDTAHARGILHRTLQSNCIFINQTGKLKVCDFGIANLIESLGGSVFHLAPPEVLLYMSPEQAKGKEEVTAAADIYSLGVISYQLLSGQLPPLQERLEDQATTLATEGISPLLMKVLRQAMANEPRQRYPTASAFVEALEKADQMNQQETMLFLDPLKRRKQSSLQKNTSAKFALAALSILFVVVLGLAMLFNRQAGAEEPPLQATLIVEQKGISDNPQRKMSPSSPISMTIGIDGMVLVYIPAGKFTMGSKVMDEQPSHQVELDAYWIDQTEVSTSMYAACVAKGACTPPVLDHSAIEADYYHQKSFHDYPMINISWQQANHYCTWAGRRLPTEAEWEKAARGVEKYIYPWGNKVIEKKSGTQLNYCDKNCSEEWQDDKIDDGYAKTAPIDSYPAGASPYGALNMAGNVSEWVADWYDEDYYNSSPARNPTGASTGEKRVLRGSSWYLDLAHARTTKRRGFAPTLRFDHVGFRCAKSP